MVDAAGAQDQLGVVDGEDLCSDCDRDDGDRRIDGGAARVGIAAVTAGLMVIGPVEGARSHLGEDQTLARWDGVRPAECVGVAGDGNIAWSSDRLVRTRSTTTDFGATPGKG